MKVAIYGKNFHPSARENVATLFSRLQSVNAELYIYKPFNDYLREHAGLEPKASGLFESHSGLPAGTDFLFSVGGDGTFLETVSLVRDSGIPVVGLNTGRLGFLSNISQESLPESLDNIFNGRYTLEDRMLLEVGASDNCPAPFNVALNEVRIYKDAASLISISVRVDDEFLSSYWADGLIISTPTGSTAYNLSVGGPIVVPESDSIVLSPIAPHNLTVRPLVLPGKAVLTLSVQTRDPHYQLALDSRSFIIPPAETISVARAPYNLKMIRLENNTFYNTLRNKLMWGMDKRN